MAWIAASSTMALTLLKKMKSSKAAAPDGAVAGRSSNEKIIQIFSYG